MCRQLISWNLEGADKHLETIAEIMDEYSPDIVFLQETKIHQNEEASICNKLGTARPFILNSPDQYLDDFTERLEFTQKTAHHGTGTVVNTDISGEKYVMYESSTHRIQHMRLCGVNSVSYTHLTLPTILLV